MQTRPTHRPKLCVTGYRLSGSTGTVFLFGIMVGAVAPLELSALWTGSRRTAATTLDAQLPTWRSPTEPATPDSNTNSEPTKETSQSTELWNRGTRASDRSPRKWARRSGRHQVCWSASESACMGPQRRSKPDYRATRSDS